ncbi:MAG: recombination protein RecR [Candidatus Fermentibacteraceae bacterium]|nr:recombination protein RecR [Candidatus Fermentibacteraceae bacterium]
MSSVLFDRLAEQLQRLPGIGRKTALRLAFNLADNREFAKDLSDILKLTWEEVGECQICRNITENEMCDICSNTSRHDSICIVHNPADMRTIEDVGLFRGKYFVLHGFLAPLEGMGPDELGISKLKKMIDNSSTDEIILALDSTADGEATSAYLARTLEKTGVRITRLARGLPPGASVEFADSLTLMQAFEGRQKV